jgi:hypothetical protein
MPRFLAAMSLVCLVACGPEGRESDDGELPVDASVGIDATGFVDATPTVDGDTPPPPAFTVYVHTRDTLYTVDPDGWEVAEVGRFETNGDNITDLAVTPNGQIFVISKTKMYTVDPATGVATFKANLSGGASAGNVGLTFLKSGELLGADDDGGVWTINTQSGASTVLGSFGASYATAGDLVATLDGTMYALSDKGPSGDENDSNLLLRVNTASGVATPVGQIGFGRVFGAAFIDGKVIAFNTEGQIIEIDPTTGAGHEVAATELEFWGAGVTPLVPGIE